MMRTVTSAPGRLEGRFFAPCRKEFTVKSRFVSLLLLFLLGAVAVLAGNFWEDKPYQQWNQMEVQTIIGHSPWSEMVQVGGQRGYDFGGFSRPESGAGAPGSISPGAEGAPTVSSNSPTGGPAEAPGSGTEIGSGTRSSQPGATTYFVVWSSSKTVRRAVAREQILRGASSEEQAEKALAQPVTDYTITILGRDMSAFADLSPDALKAATTLKPKKLKQELHPTAVQISRSSMNESVVSVTFSFPRTLESGQPVVSDKEKKVEFECEVKDAKIKIRAIYDVRQMTLNGTQDL